MESLEAGRHVQNGVPMMIKGVKPRTHLMIDFLLFALLGVVLFSAIMEHAVTQEGTHPQSMFHRIHGIAGGVMCLTLGVHLYMHLPWIWSQLRHLFKSQV